MPSNDEGALTPGSLRTKIETCVGRHGHHNVLLVSQHGQVLLTAHRNVRRQTFAQQNGIIDLASQPTAADREGGDRADTGERPRQEFLASVLVR